MGLQGFNLLKQQPSPPTTWEKIYLWVLGTARVVIIIVEIIVIAAFVIRIVVDTQGSRIEKEIENREMAISGFEESEVRYRTIQTRTRNYQNLWENSSNISPIMEELNQLFSGDFADLRVSVERDLLTVRGEATIEKISALEKAVKESDSFRNVETFEVTSEDAQNSSRGNFGLRAVIKEVGSRKKVDDVLKETKDQQTDPNINVPGNDQAPPLNDDELTIPQQNGN